MTRFSPGNRQKAENGNTFSLIQALIEPGRRWFGIFVFLLLGALAGYGAHFIIPPLYSSSAAVTFAIDFTRTGEMTDVETDIAIVTVGDIMASSTVIEKTLAAGLAAGLPEDSFIFESTAFLERYSFRYKLVVENSDPQVAAKWANLWAEQALAVLRDAKSHALSADNLYKQMLAVQNCLQQPGLSEPVAGGCQGLSMQEQQAMLTEFNTAYIEEKEGSLGFLPALDFALTSNAEPGLKPGRQQTGAMVLGGAFLGGIFISGWIFITRRQHRRP